MVKERPELTEAKRSETQELNIKDVFTTKCSRRREWFKWSTQQRKQSRYLCVSTTIGISMYLTYKRVIIALKRIVTLKLVLILTCKRVVRYSVIRMTHYLSKWTQLLINSLSCSGKKQECYLYAISSPPSVSNLVECRKCFCKNGARLWMKMNEPNLLLLKSRWFA